MESNFNLKLFEVVIERNNVAGIEDDFNFYKNTYFSVAETETEAIDRATKVFRSQYPDHTITKIYLKHRVGFIV